MKQIIGCVVGKCYLLLFITNSQNLKKICGTVQLCDQTFIQTISELIICLQ